MRYFVLLDLSEGGRRAKWEYKARRGPVHTGGSGGRMGVGGGVGGGRDPSAPGRNQVLRPESQSGQASQGTRRKERLRERCWMPLPGHLQAIREGEFLPSQGMSHCQRQWLSPGDW